MLLLASMAVEAFRDASQRVVCRFSVRIAPVSPKMIYYQLVKDGYPERWKREHNNICPPVEE